MADETPLTLGPKAVKRTTVRATLHYEDGTGVVSQEVAGDFVVAGEGDLFRRTMTLGTRVLTFDTLGASAFLVDAGIVGIRVLSPVKKENQPFVLLRENGGSGIQIFPGVPFIGRLQDLAKWSINGTAEGMLVDIFVSPR